MPRLFVALEVPPLVSQQIAMLRGGLPGARWIDPENHHITLRFIGDIDDHIAHEAEDCLFGIRRDPVMVDLDGLGVFGGNKPHSLFVRVRPTSDLVALNGDIERRLRRIGLKPETRNFTPHVTVARLRGVSPRAAASYLGLRGGFGIPAFEADRFVMYSSRAREGGGPYVVEQTYPLGQAYDVDAEDDYDLVSNWG
ncbi:MAG: RNA 2',3'-cyclic phosphodiesterase [Pseudomonadota bacterium]